MYLLGGGLRNRLMFTCWIICYVSIIIVAMNKSKKKIISFPRMGNVSIPVKAVLETMGAKVKLPPENNKQTLDYGVRYGLEGVCLPYKLNLGNYIMALESGANTLLMFQAPGTCRFGKYTDMASQVLKDLGYDFEMVVFDMYKGKIKEVVDALFYITGTKSFIKVFRGLRLCFKKFYAVDDIERRLFYLRPRELNPGESEKIYKRGIKLIDKAKNSRQMKKIMKKIFAEFDSIKIDREKDIPIIYLTGEIFVLLDPYTNMDIEKELGKMGVEVQRQIMLSDWLEHVLKPKFLCKKESHRQRSTKYAKNFMTRAIGGDCLESIGDAVYAAQHDADGVIHLTPFNCNPETVTQNILPNVSDEENIPVISLILDEFTAKAGFITRLEAFVDLIKRKRRLKNDKKELVIN